MTRIQSRIQVFVSFDGEHDRDLCSRLEAEADQPGSVFEVSGSSLGGAMNEAWTARARSRIRAADEVVVICGEHTAESMHVAAEMRIALEEGTPYLLLWGRRKQMCTKPAGAKRDDGMYSWTRDVLDAQLASTLRSSGGIEVPESMKGPQR